MDKNLHTSEYRGIAKQKVPSGHFGRGPHGPVESGLDIRTISDDIVEKV
jgi:hypothetical protein